MRPLYSKRQGFTLIEIMIVVAIMGIVLTMGIPSIYHMLHPESMQKGVKDVLEACAHARAEAILQGIEVDLVIHPQERQLQVVRSAAPAPETGPTGPSLIPVEPQQSSPDGTPAQGSSISVQSDPSHGIGFTAQLSESLLIDMCDVNFGEYKDLDEARVHFYPNGTCDEFTLVLRSAKGEYRKITLEVVTALANVENLENLR